MQTFYVLFENLPFDHHIQLPVDLGAGVRLADPSPAYDVINRCQVHQVTLVPYHLRGQPLVRICLARDLKASTNEQKARDDVYLAYYAMRLAMPVLTATSGALIIEDGQVVSPTRDARGAFRSACSGPAYTIDAFETARVLNLRMRTLKGPGLDRMRSALALYSHVDLGSVQSWQLTYLGLVGVLECVFPQPFPRTVADRMTVRDASYGDRLGRRVAAFLRGSGSARGLAAFIAGSYKARRNKVAHGFHPVRGAGRLRKQNAKLVLRLHHISRLVLLGMLSLENDVLAALLPSAAGALAVQNGLDEIATVRGYKNRGVHWR